MGNKSLKDLNYKMKFITSYYKKLISYTKQNKSVGSINEWVIDNYYLISEQHLNLKNDLKSRNIKKISYQRKQLINKVINLFLVKENYKITSTSLFEYLNNYQIKNLDYFTYDEIDYLNIALKLNIIFKLNGLCHSIKYKFIEKEKIENNFKKVEYYLNNQQPFNIYKYIKIDHTILHNYFYILEINYRLNNLGELSGEVFKKLNELLLANNMFLKDIINQEQEERTNENILMVNLFDTFKKVIKYKLEDLYVQISLTEHELINEKNNTYDSMYESSKIEYRNKIKTVVAKDKLNEYQYVKGLVEKANQDNRHIGFYLFEEFNYNLRARLYIATVIVLTISLSLLGSFSMGFVAFFILLIPVGGFIIDVINQILLKIIKTRSLFRIKLENALPVQYSTMVIIPTILKDPAKVNQMFDNLELYYLSNRSDNLYFTLLGDVTSEKVKQIPMDELVVAAGIKKSSELNEKYGPNIFNFIYRNRFYNASEQAFLGYERKRGAIQHFNALILGLLSEPEKTKYFKYHSFDTFKPSIKYVITLDADTKLLLNTAFKLIGTMVHPMNKAVLSNDGTKVIKGYGIMQPRVSIDVEVTNKSIYSQLFAGLGGLDIYSTKHFDLYQDVFNEGSFIGKGIYDLELFNKILNDTLPENLILSHDLLEGNYLRCGYISDIELFDGFPSKYLNDAMRHHRWTRGDWQIVTWLKGKVNNIKHVLIDNPINLIGKWKIFDNLIRSLKSPFLLLLLIYGFTLSKTGPAIILALVVMIIALPIFFYLLTQALSKQKYDMFLRYYLNLIWGLLAVVNKSLIVLALLPYETYLYLNAIIKSLYRMFFSKKNLLNWITSEEVDAMSKNNITNYLWNFKINYLIAFLIVVLAYYFKPDYIYLAYFLAVIWSFAPFLMYGISKDTKEQHQMTSNAIKSEIRNLGLLTWKFFDEYLNEEYNYLMPDNYQLNREEKIDYRTSPTNIGFAIISVISAYELKYIKEQVAIDKLNNIIKNVEKLNKWHGHLYNWYDTKQMKEISPLFISTADSGNFVSCLYVLKGFLERMNRYKVLQYRVSRLINEADFSKLYNTESDVFSIGYSVYEGILVPYNYNNFLSEARLASFISIAKGDAPFKHWFCLDKTLTKYKHYKGIVSWTGTMFEYYMPLIFMKSFKHTLLDETYLFAYYAHKEFIKEANPNLPWGITESAYNELDDSQNYKYKAFGIPYLKFHDSETPQIVIAPYGSIMALDKYPMDVYTNIKKMQKLGMNGEYGLYESYDNEDKTVVKAYFAHHQGMILSSIANYLKDNIIQEYFHTDKKIQSVEILLKEKVQVRTYIDLKIEKYKKYNYKREVQDNDIREQEGIMPVPEVGVLSNGLYSTFINDRGVGFSKYKNLQINRYRKITDENYGMFIYIKNLDTNKVWTNTYYPTCGKTGNYHVVFASDRIKYVRENDKIITTTEITVTKDHNAEIRKITIENGSDRDINLELTSYSEIIMARPEEDVGHRVFNNITIDSQIDEKTSSLIFSRDSRTKVNTNYFVINRFFGEKDNKEFEFEISRLNFMGRNNTTANPAMIMGNEKLSSNINALLDPIMSIRKSVNIKANGKKTLYLIVGFGKSKEQVLEIVNTYKDKKTIDTAFNMATVLNNMRNTYANLNGRELRSYNTMLKYIFQTLPINATRQSILEHNTLSQSNLWRFGISGDLPIILVNVNDIEKQGFIKEILQAYEFYKSRAIYIDIVIINAGTSDKKELIENYINNLMYRINNLNYFENSPGYVYVIKELTNDELVLLKTIAKVYLDSSINKSLNEQIVELDTGRTLMLENNHKVLLPIIKPKTIPLAFENQYGGFTNDGKEYLIKTNDTPMPWSNVLANESFGTVITNNFGGFTYAYNSREFKLTSWSNDAISDPASEIICINNQKVVPSSVKHGFGYSTFTVNTNEYDLDINVFIPTKDNVKIYDLNINNKTKNSLNLNLDFIIRPVLGTSEEQTNRHLLSVFDEPKNSLLMRNVYNKNFKNEQVFLSSTEPIINVDLQNIVTKSITVNVDVKTNKKLAFMLGCGNNLDDLLTKYNDINNIMISFDEVVQYWVAKLSIIQVKTPDESFNYMVNGWYLYQVYASRLYAKAAFYQVGGATGFRDQLQDSMGLLYTNPAYAKQQILKHAAHQFVEGDVLHWWHEELLFGARTKFSDDYLWLIYVTYEYLKVTNDYSILDEKVPFAEGEHLAGYEVEKGINFSYTANQESLYYHLKIAIEKAIRQMGSHGLPLMGNGDWNDGMNKVGDKGHGESVWVGFFLYDLLLKMPDIIHDDDTELIKLCSATAQSLKEAINIHAWDGKWYLRAFFDDGTPLGSHANLDCQIDLISQSWSILTGIADQKRIDSVIKEVEKRLVDRKNNIIKLLDSPFLKHDHNPGYISDYLPGVRENGAQYTHAALWYIMALIKSGNIDLANQYYTMINPINRNSDVYQTEPYVIAADIYSNKNYPGKGGWTWYTGSASWAYKIAIEEILGIKKRGNKLEINPNMNSDWKNVEFEYQYEDTIYKIIINNTKKMHVIELVNDHQEHSIVIKEEGNNDHI